MFRMIINWLKGISSRSYYNIHETCLLENIHTALPFDRPCHGCKHLKQSDYLDYNCLHPYRDEEWFQKLAIKHCYKPINDFFKSLIIKGRKWNYD